VLQAEHKQPDRGEHLIDGTPGRHLLVALALAVYWVMQRHGVS